MNDLIDEHNHGVFPDFMCLDVEGLDFDILAGARFAPGGPKVICVEAVSGADSDDSARLVELLPGRGFVLQMRTVGNLIFADAASAARLSPPR